MDITGTTPTSRSSSTISAYNSLGPDEFLKLLIAELQTQDPLSPMDTSAMVTQLSTLSMVSESRATRQSQEFVQAVGMLGRIVTWQNPATGGIIGGQVSAVYRDGSEARLVVNGTSLKLPDVLTIS